MSDILGLLDKMVISRLSTEEAQFFNEIYEDYLKTGDKTRYDAWMTPRLIMLESKYRMDALDKLLQRKYYNLVCDGFEDLTVDELKTKLPYYSQCKAKQDKEEEIKNSDYVFITVAPELGSSYISCIKYTDKLMKLKFVNKYLYVLEQRFNGVPNELYKQHGDGLHLHYLIHKSNRDYKRSHIIRDINRCFGTMKINIDFKYIKEADLLKVQNYMIGDKADEDKQIKQQYDKEWREKVGIRPYYGDLMNC